MDARSQRHPGSFAFPEDAYSCLLQEARDVADKARERLRSLCEHFPEALPAEDLERLRRTEAWDRRRGVRWPLRQVQIEAQPVDAVGPAAAGRLLDQSVSGVGIWLTWPVPAGTYMHVWVDPTQHDEPALVEVKRCQETDEGWVLGCEVFDDSFRL